MVSVLEIDFRCSTVSINLVYKNNRSSRPEVFCKKGVLKI